MKMTTREFIRTFGIGGAALAAAPLVADEAGKGGDAAGVIGDPKYGTCRYIKDIPKMPVDVPSATLDGGHVVQPAREVPVFRRDSPPRSRPPGPAQRRCCSSATAPLAGSSLTVSC